MHLRFITTELPMTMRKPLQANRVIDGPKVRMNMKAMAGKREGGM